jgi:hypothetical protein
VIGGCVLWVRGYPDRAPAGGGRCHCSRYRGGASPEHRPRRPPVGHLAELMDDWEGVRKANEATMALATEWGLSGLRHQVASARGLVAVARTTTPEQMEYKRGIRSPALRARSTTAFWRRLMAVGVRQEGLQVIRESLAWASKREVSSSMLSCTHPCRTAPAHAAHGQAEHSYRKALEVAQGQGAWMWALRAAAIWHRCCAITGGRRKPGTSWHPIHGWFTKASTLTICKGRRGCVRTCHPHAVHHTDESREQCFEAVSSRADTYHLL